MGLAPSKIDTVMSPQQSAQKPTVETTLTGILNNVIIAVFAALFRQMSMVDLIAYSIVKRTLFSFQKLHIILYSATYSEAFRTHELRVRSSVTSDHCHDREAGIMITVLEEGVSVVHH